MEWEAIVSFSSTNPKLFGQISKIDPSVTTRGSSSFWEESVKSAVGVYPTEKLKTVMNVNPKGFFFFFASFLPLFP